MTSREEVNKQKKAMIRDFSVWAVRNLAHTAQIYMQPRVLQARGEAKTVQENCEQS